MLDPSPHVQILIAEYFIKYFNDSNIKFPNSPELGSSDPIRIQSKFGNIQHSLVSSYVFNPIT